MRFALLQTSFTKPTVNQLKRAFRVVPELTDLDAATKETQGILMRGLDESLAEQLQAALRREDVAVSLVREADLPILPLGRAVRRLEFAPEHFGATDPLGRRLEVPWRDVLILAAGQVMPSRLDRTRPGSAELEQEARGRGTERGSLVGDIFLRDRLSRYTIDAEQFDFSYLDQRLTKDPASNLGFLIQDLVQFSPDAGLNRGANQFRELPHSAYSYPGKHAYNEELMWLLWLSQSDAEVRNRPADSA